MKYKLPLFFANAILYKQVTQNGFTVSHTWSNDRHVLQLESERWGKISGSVMCPPVFIGESTINMRPTVTVVSIKGEICILMPTTSEVFDVPEDPLHVRNGVTSATVLGPLLAIADVGGHIHLYNQDTACTLTGITELATTVDDGRVASPTTLTLYRASDEYLLLAGYNDGLVRKYRVPWSVAHSRVQGRIPVTLPQISMIKPPSWFGEIMVLKASPKGYLLIADDKSVCVIHVQSSVSFFKRRMIIGLKDVFISGDTLYISSYKDVTEVNLGAELSKFRNELPPPPDTDDDESDDEQGDMGGILP